MKIASIPLLASVAAAEVLQLGINKIAPGHHTSRLARRATYIENLANNITGGGYYADVSVGSPPQPQRMVLDTGSSDIWVVAYNADLCTSQRMQEYYGDTCSDVFTPSKSSSFELVDRRAFSIKYLDGTASTGDYITDDFSIANTTIKSLQMGYATKVVRGTGILGIGFSNHVAAATPYPNIMDELVKQNIIPTKAYSLYLNDRRSPEGSILFGGIDTEKFIGNLEVVPIIKDISSGKISSFTVDLEGITVAYPNGSKADIKMPAAEMPTLLDSGTTLSYLPQAMAEDLFEDLGAVTDFKTTGLTFIPCDYLGANSRPKSDPQTLTISFTFGNKTIRVPVQEMVLDVFADYDGPVPIKLPFDNACLFGIQSLGGFSGQSNGIASADFLLLGDTFLRSAYVVYDLTHQQIGLAQANLNSTASKIVELRAEDKSIPSLTGVPAQQQQASPTASKTAGTTTDKGGNVVTVTASPSPSPSNVAGRSGRAPGGDSLVIMAAAGAFAVLGGALMVL